MIKINSIQDGGWGSLLDIACQNAPEKIEVSKQVLKKLGLQVPKLVISKHAVQRLQERIRSLQKSGTISVNEVGKLFSTAISKGQEVVSVFGKKTRLEVGNERFKLLVVLAPVHKGKGLEIVTLWSPTHNQKKES